MGRYGYDAVHSHPATSKTVFLTETAFNISGMMVELKKEH